MTTPEVLILWTRIFEGPRHDRLYRIWDRISAQLPENVAVVQERAGGAIP